MVTRLAVLLFIAITSAAAQTPARPPTNPPHLAEMPLPDRVVREITSPDPIEAATRQMGAFEQLREIIAELSSGRVAIGTPTSDEDRIRNEYLTAQNAVLNRVRRNPQDAALYSRLQRLNEDPALRGELLAKFFSPAFRAQSTAISNELAARRAVMRQQNTAFGGAAIQQPTAGPNAPAAAGAFAHSSKRQFCGYHRNNYSAF